MSISSFFAKIGAGTALAAGAAIGLVVAGMLAPPPSARADTILWASDGRGAPGPSLDEWDLNVAADTGTLINSFAVPNVAAQGGGPGGIAILGSTIYYSVAHSGSVFLTNASGADLGVAFNTGLPGISAITSDGSFLYLAATGDKMLTENVYKYTLSGSLVNTITIVPTALGAPFVGGRAGLELVGGNFVANQGNDEGPYSQYDSSGNLLAAELLKPTDDFGFSGVAFDGTDYFAGNVEDVPSTFWVFDTAGTLLKQLMLTGCPGPNQLCEFGDLAVAPVAEPASFALLAVMLAGLGGLSRLNRGFVAQNKVS